MLVAGAAGLLYQELMLLALHSAAYTESSSMCPL